MFTASGLRAEAEAVCNAIVRAAQEGTRYRDMAVIVSDMETYAPLLNRTMRRYRIPFLWISKDRLTGIRFQFCF